MTPDPSFLLMTDSHREALSGLLYALMERKGFVVMTGDAGMGKTTLLRTAIRSSKSCRFSVILNPSLSAKEFLELALLDFGMIDVPESKAQRIVRLQELLVKFHEEGFAPVLLVDEAHKLSPEVLEEIRLLTNFETTEKKLLQIVLAGQTELVSLLNREDLRQLKQRIEVRLVVNPLSQPDVEVYMRHRWNRAGGMEALPFSAEAIAMVARASRGIPRLVNSICDNALLLAFSQPVPSITATHIREVLRDLDLRDSLERTNGRHASHHEAGSRPEPPAVLRTEWTTPMGAPLAEPIPIPFIERYMPTPSKEPFVKRLFGAANGGRNPNE